MLAIVYSCGRRPLDYHLRELRVSLYSFYYAQACSESPLTVAVVHDFVSLRGSVCNRALLLRVPAGDPLSRTRHTNDGPNEALACAYSLKLLLLLPAKRLHFIQLYPYICACQIQLNGRVSASMSSIVKGDVTRAPFATCS